MKDYFETGTAQETEELAKKILPEILNNKFIQLSGPLGSGKTTFVKGLAKALGINDLIKSPTYTYLNKYEIKSIRAAKYLYHFDLYRLPEKPENPELISAQIGLEEALESSKNIVVVEWSERLLQEKKALKLSFAKKGDLHEISITSP